MKSGLDRARVWITGASGGIGRSLVSAFAAEGCQLWLSAGEQHEALRSWVDEQALAAHCAGLDVTDPADCTATVSAATAALGGLDVCVVNAGIWPSPDVPLAQMSPERLRRVLDVNLTGALFTAQAFLAGLAPDQPAHLCFIGSTAGRFGEPQHVAYAASKAALRGVVRSLCVEITYITAHGRVNLVEPGWTRTDMAEATLEAPGVLERALATTPLQRIAQPSDIANAVVWLSSPTLARHVTGEMLTVSGGMDGRVRGEVDAEAVRRRAREER